VSCVNSPTESIIQSGSIGKLKAYGKTSRENISKVIISSPLRVDRSGTWTEGYRKVV
jgi:hypothetical protein